MNCDENHYKIMKIKDFQVYENKYTVEVYLKICNAYQNGFAAPWGPPHEVQKIMKIDKFITNA